MEEEEKTITEKKKKTLYERFPMGKDGRREAKESAKLREFVKSIAPTPKKRQILGIRDEVINEIVDLKEKGRKVDVSTIIREAMRRHGYSESSIQKLKIVETKAWQDSLDIYLPDNLLLTRLLDLVLSKNERIALGAIQESNKLKNKYPATKVQLEAYREDMDKFTEVVVDIEEAEVEEVKAK